MHSLLVSPKVKKKNPLIEFQLTLTLKYTKQTDLWMMFILKLGRDLQALFSLLSVSDKSCLLAVVL